MTESPDVNQRGIALFQKRTKGGDAVVVGGNFLPAAKKFLGGRGQKMSSVKAALDAELSGRGRGRPGS